MKRPMILCATVCILLSLFVLQVNTTIVTTLATLSFIALAALCFFKSTRKYVIIVAVAFLFLLNTARIKINYIDKLKVLEKEDFTVNAVITDVVRKDDYFLLDLNVTDSKGKLPDNTKLCLTHYKEGVLVGDEITAKIRLSGIEDSQYKKSNYSEGIFASGYIREIVNKEYGANVYRHLANFKAKVNNILFSNMSYTHASFSAALTVGDSSYIDNDLYKAVKRSGVSHVIVVSGLHMAIICGSIHKLLNKVRFNRQLSAILTILFMVFFMALCGFTPSVLRAGVMYGTFLLSRIFLRKRDGLNSLSIAVTLMLIFNPFLIWNIGFLLSASATFGIIVILPIIEEHIDKYIKNRVLNAVLKTSSVTLSALITTLPISVYYFGGISLVSIFTNIFISSAVSVLLIFTVIAIVFGLISGSNFLVHMLFNGAEMISVYIVAVIRFFGNLPFASVPCNIWVLSAVYILVIAIFLILKYTNIINRKKRSV